MGRMILVGLEADRMLNGLWEFSEMIKVWLSRVTAICKKSSWNAFMSSSVSGGAEITTSSDDDEERSLGHETECWCFCAPGSCTSWYSGVSGLAREATGEGTSSLMVDTSFLMLVNDGPRSPIRSWWHPACMCVACRLLTKASLGWLVVVGSVEVCRSLSYTVHRSPKGWLPATNLQGKRCAQVMRRRSRLPLGTALTNKTLPVPESVLVLLDIITRDKSGSA